jgi:hypothetical protein
MSAICIVCYLTLLVIGVQFLRLNASLLRLFSAVMIFEVVYFFTIAFAWMSPGIGMSIAAASGVANGGLMLQLLPLFPLWGPLLAHWAKQNMGTSPWDDQPLYFASEQINRSTDWVWAAVNCVVVFALTSVLIGMAWSQLNDSSIPPTLVVLGIPALLSATNALQSVRSRRNRRREDIERRHAVRLKAGLCPRCEYSLMGLTRPRCPECGMEFPASALEKAG